MKHLRGRQFQFTAALKVPSSLENRNSRVGMRLLCRNNF